MVCKLEVKYMKKEVCELYKKIIEYAFSICDSFSITKIFSQHKEEEFRIRKIILESENIDEQALVEKYSKEYLEYLVSKYYYNKDIFSKYKIEKISVEEMNIGESIEELKKAYGDFANFKEYYETVENVKIEVNTYDELNYDNFFNKIFYDDRRCIIESAINSYIYDNFLDTWTEKNKKDLIKKAPIFMLDYEYGIEYYFKTNLLTKKQILDYNSIYDFSYPMVLEDISFFKDGKLWLSSVSHERNFFIKCSNADEMMYLKKLGVPKESLLCDF